LQGISTHLLHRIEDATMDSIIWAAAVLPNHHSSESGTASAQSYVEGSISR